MEGQRFWPGEGRQPKYPNGCQDRCFAAACLGASGLAGGGRGASAIGVFDGSGGESGEKPAQVKSSAVTSNSGEARRSGTHLGEPKKTFLGQRNDILI